MRLDVAGDVVRVHEGAFVVAGEQLALTGTVTRQPKTFRLDLRATADAIDAERLLRAFRAARPSRETLPAGTAGRWPHRRRREERHLRSVRRAAALGYRHARAGAHRGGREGARLCDLALPLRAVLVPGSASVTSKIAARPAGRRCGGLPDRRAPRADRDVRSRRRPAASGPVDELARAARGTFRFTARDGEILKAPAIARILSLDAVGAVLRARPRADGERPRLQRARGRGRGDAGLVRVESTLNAAALGLAMTGEIDVPADRSTCAASSRRSTASGACWSTSRSSAKSSAPASSGSCSASPVTWTTRGSSAGPAAIGQSVVNLLGAVVKMPIDLLDPFVGRPQPAR